MGQLGNISLSTFRAFLVAQGLSYSHTTGGHEVWKKSGLTRPVVLQTHIDPIPEAIIRTNLHTMGVDRKVLVEFLKK